jgi:hypothetical protein
MFKKPGGDTAKPCLWATLREEMAEQLLSRGEGDCWEGTLAAVSKRAAGRNVVAV